jgi:hypothetical protein
MNVKNQEQKEVKEEETEEVDTTIKDSAPDVTSAMDMDTSQRTVLKQTQSLSATTVNNLDIFLKIVLTKELKERNKLIVSAAEMMVTSQRTVPKRLESVSNVIKKDTLPENAQPRRKDDVICILFSLTIVFFCFLANTSL